MQASFQTKNCSPVMPLGLWRVISFERITLYSGRMSRMKKKLIKAWKPNPTIIKVDLTNPAQGVTHSLDANLSTHDFAGAAAACLSAALKQVFPEMKFDVEWVVSLSMDNPAGRYGRFMIVRRGDFEYGGEGNPAIQLTQEEYEELHKDRKV